MAASKLVVARADVETSKARLLGTVDEIKHRLNPKVLASDAWHEVKHAGSGYANKGVHAVSDRPAAAGGAVAAIALFLLRGPISRLLSAMFGNSGPKGRVTSDLSSADTEFDLTAPVVPKTSRS